MTSEDKILTLNNLEDFLNNSSLYEKFQANNDHKLVLFYLLSQEIQFDSHCIECEKSSTFRAEKVDNFTGTVPTRYEDNKAYSWIANISNLDEIYTRIFKCSRLFDHKIIFVFQIKNGFICKIGQSPSIADINEFNIKKYKNILGKDYKEFSKAIGLYSHGIGVGSYVYLRRIIENFIVKPAYEIAKIETLWNEEEYQRSRFKEKMLILKSYLPIFFTDNSNIYSILSKGIHELSEEDCLTYFPLMKAAIESILQEIKSKKEKEEINNTIANNLSIITGKLNKE